MIRVCVLVLLLLVALPYASLGHEMPREARKALVESASLLEAGMHADALAVLQQYTAAHPQEDVPLVHLQLGNAWMMGGDPARAEAAYARCLELKPEQPVALRNRGHALWDIDRFDEAARSFERAHAVVTPADDELLRHAAMAWYQAGDPARCASIMEQFALGGDAKREWVELYAHALVELERYADARRCLRGAVERMPGDAALWEALSIVCRLSGLHAEAASAMEVQFALAEPAPARWKELSALYAWLGHHARAAQALEKVLGDTPAREDLEDLLELWRSAGDAERTLGILDRMLRVEPAPEVAAMKAQELCRLGRLDEAWTHLSSLACAKEAECAGAWLELGECFLRAGASGKAMDALSFAAAHARTRKRAEALRVAYGGGDTVAIP